MGAQTHRHGIGDQIGELDADALGHRGNAEARDALDQRAIGFERRSDSESEFSVTRRAREDHQSCAGQSANAVRKSRAGDLHAHSAHEQPYAQQLHEIHHDHSAHDRRSVAGCAQRAAHGIGDQQKRKRRDHGSIINKAFAEHIFIRRIHHKLHDRRGKDFADRHNRNAEQDREQERLTDRARGFAFIAFAGNSGDQDCRAGG